MNLLRKKEKGQTLIEVLIALAAAVAIISAIAITVVTSLSNVEFTKNQNLATQYAREGMEVVRQMARNSWPTFTTFTSVNYCLPQGATSLCVMGSLNCGTSLSCGQNVAGIFVRQITIDQTSVSCGNNGKVTSTVSWSDSKCSTGNVFCHQVKLESCVADINTIKTP